MNKQNFAAIDFETANGYSSSICSVGIVIVRNGEIAEKIYRLVRPEPNEYWRGFTEIHGITYEETESAPIFPDVWAEIAPQIAALPLVAHNSRFDEHCLKTAFRTYQMDYPDYEFHCTLRASRKVFSRPHNLRAVAVRCGFDLQNHHHALADAEACAVIALKLL